MRRLRLPLCLALVGSMWAGCRHAAITPTPEGGSSFRFVAPPLPPPSKAKISSVTTGSPQQVINAQPIFPLATPVYPPVALKAGAGTVIVGVRITVDTDGRVSDVGASLAALSTPSPFVTEFRAAVEAAVAQWRFRPGEVRHLESVNAEGGDYLRMTGREKVEWAFDVEFAFSALGDVLTKLPK